jgi:protein ImuB
LPSWPTDRLRRAAPPEAFPSDRPLVTFASDGRRLTLAACDAAARAAGLAPGLPLAEARARLPGLLAAPADPGADAAALTRLAWWGLRYTPLVAPAPPDGLWLDITGCAHLFGGEAALCDDLRARLASCRLGVAETPGRAWARARFAEPFPVEALRLPAETAALLRRLGFATLASLAAAPRAPLRRRFGAGLLDRLDAFSGQRPEPIQPLAPPEGIAARRAFAEPLLTADSFTAVLEELLAETCAALAARGEGARRLDLIFERVDGARPFLAIGTSTPVRHAAPLARLFAERLPTLDPGLGVEAMELRVTRADPRVTVQTRLDGAPDDAAPLAALIDTLANRLGPDRLWSPVAVQSRVPERAVAAGLPSGAPAVPWPAPLPRPLRLFSPPQRVEAMALLPDHPPLAFTWRRVRHRIRRADGPERIGGEWWRRPGEEDSVRDYFAVEDEEGRRFWLFRRGDGVDPAAGDLAWFLHGVF